MAGNQQRSSESKKDNKMKPPTAQGAQEQLPEQALATSLEVQQFRENPQEVRPETVLRMQRTVGNQAVQRMLFKPEIGRLPGHSDAPSFRVSGRVQLADVVSGKVSDKPYGWNYKYSVKFSDDECTLTIKASMTATDHADGRGKPSGDDVGTVKTEAETQFKNYYDAKFVLVEKDLDRKYTLRTKIVWVESDADLNIKLYKGSGTNTLSKWYVDSLEGITRAHELGHALGLKDEYVSSKTESRKTRLSPGVYEDSSLMGDYKKEGVEKAEVKIRHGDVLAEDISKATARSFWMMKK